MEQLSDSAHPTVENTNPWQDTDDEGSTGVCLWPLQSQHSSSVRGPREENGVYLDIIAIIMGISQVRTAKGSQPLRGCPGDFQQVLMHLRLWVRHVRRKPPKEREELFQRIRKPQLELIMGWVTFGSLTSYLKNRQKSDKIWQQILFDLQDKVSIRQRFI